MRAAALIIGLTLAASPARAAAPTPLEAPVQEGYHLRGVVGQSISVALPNREGHSWHWEASGKLLFALPYKVSYTALASPEIWTFPLVQPGTVTLVFKLVPQGVTSKESPESRKVELQVLTPYEAQQQPLASMLDTLLLR